MARVSVTRLRFAVCRLPFAVCRLQFAVTANDDRLKPVLHLSETYNHSALACSMLVSKGVLHGEISIDPARSRGSAADGRAAGRDLQGVREMEKEPHRERLAPRR